MRKLTQEYVENYCLERGYKIIGQYVNSCTKIKMQNIKTGLIGEMEFNNFKQGHRFDNPDAKVKLTQEKVSRYCKKYGYYLRSQYINSNTKIKLENIKTRAIGWQRLGEFKQGKRFDNPDTKVKLAYQEYVQPFISESYTILMDEKKYKNVNSLTKVNVLCQNGHQWSVTRDGFVSAHRRCPMCTSELNGGMSHGERLIYSILSGNGIDFKREVSININGERHRFDFYLKLNNKKYFIEYDGIQHYKESTGYLKGKLAEQQRKDRVKDQYALDKGIIMIRIPYTNNTVDQVIKMINDKTRLNLHKVKVDTPKKQEVLDYYLNHELEETADRFGINIATVIRYAQDIWGISKTEYSIKIGKKVSSKKIADYYLKHLELSSRDVGSGFGICATTVIRYFKREYGMSRTEYLKTLDK